MTETISITVVQMQAWMWVVYILVAVVGSLANSLVSNGGGLLKLSSQDDRISLGAFADVVIGIAAALGILWAFSPQTIFQLIGMGAITGFGGSSVLRNLVNSIQVGQGDRRVAEVQADASENIESAEGQIVRLREDFSTLFEFVQPLLDDEAIQELQTRGLIP